MNENRLFQFLSIVIFSIACTAAASAQSGLDGRYYYDKKIDDGRNTLRLVFEIFKTGNRAIYINTQDGVETQRRVGRWTYNAKSKRLTVVLPPVKDNPMQGQEVRLTFIFEVAGDRLKLIRDLPYREGRGELYRRF